MGVNDKSPDSPGRGDYRPLLSDIQKAKQRIAAVVASTPLARNNALSERHGADVWLKREDMQHVRSYKIRGAFNKIASLSREELERGVVCASAGNHAQGVAFAASRLEARATIFMPKPTPQQKIKQVRMFGREFADILLTGDTYDDSCEEAVKFCESRGSLLHPSV